MKGVSVRRRLFQYAIGVGIGLCVVLPLAWYWSPGQGPEALLSCVVNGERGASMSQSCVRNEMPSILNSASASEVLDYVTASTTPHVVFKNCHGITHSVGEALYARTGSVEKGLSECTEQCLGGCMHGVIESAVEEEFGDAAEAEDVAHAGDALFKSGSKYCAVADLCHGIGHVMYKNFQTYEKSLAACDSVSDAMSNQRCYEGVFMEGLGGESSFGFPQAPNIEQNSTDDYAYPCNAQPSTARLACFLYLPAFQDALFLDQNIFASDEKLRIQRDVCGEFEGVDRNGCFLGMAAGATLRVFKRDFTSASFICEVFDTESDRTSCSIGLVMNWVASYLEPRVINYCAAIPETSRRDACFLITFELLSREGEGRAERACAESKDPRSCTDMLSAFNVQSAIRLEKTLFGRPI